MHNNQQVWQLGYNFDTQETIRTWITLNFSAAAEESACQRVAKQEKLYAYIARMRGALNMFQGQCAFCYMVDASLQAFHSINICPNLPNTKFNQYIAFRNQIRYNKTVTNICWMCHVPSCNDILHQPFEGKKETNCEYRDIILPICYAIFHMPQYCKAAEQDMQTKWQTIHAFTTWLSGKPATDQKSQPTALFLWFHDKFVKSRSI